MSHRSINDLAAKWREIAAEQDGIAESDGLTDAERDWHLARSQQAEDCADELEAALTPAGEGGLPELPEALDEVHVFMGCRSDDNSRYATPAGDYYSAADLLAYGDARALAATLEGPWKRMESCPVGEKVLFWNQETEEMFFGQKPEDAPSVEAVVTEFPHTAAWADAWMPKPLEPEGETNDAGDR